MFIFNKYLITYPATMSIWNTQYTRNSTVRNTNNSNVQGQTSSPTSYLSQNDPLKNINMEKE